MDEFGDGHNGAEWIWNLAEQHFPRAVQIVDLYPARQHPWELVRKLHPNDEAKQKAWMRAHQKRLLDKEKIEKLVAAIAAIHSSNPELAEKIRLEADYFRGNAERKRYPRFVPNTYSWAPALSNRAAKRSSAHASKDPACSGGPRCQYHHRSPMLPSQRPV